MLSTFLKSSHSVIRRTSNSMLLSAIKSNLRIHANTVSDSKASLLDSPGWSPLKCKQVWLCLFHYYRIRHFSLFFFNWREMLYNALLVSAHTTMQISRDSACIPSLPSPIPPFWEPQTCREVVSSWDRLFHLTAQDPHESPLPCAALWHMESRNGSCYLCILWLLSWWLEAPSVELGRRSPQWDGTRSSSLSTEDATQQTGTRGASSGFPLRLLSPDSASEQPTQQGGAFHSFCVPISPIGLWSPHFVCYSPSCPKSPVIFSPGHNQSPRLIDLKPLEWPLLMADFHLLIEISSFELMLNILIFQ